jgi:hypothetical protein
MKMQGSGPGPCTVFLHERVSKAGHRRLVRVEALRPNGLAIDRGYEVTVIEPGSLWREPRDVGPAQSFQYSGATSTAYLSFAQADPNDPSHFWFDFTADNMIGPYRHGTIDAWLNDDDTVRFKLRDPASTRGL